MEGRMTKRSGDDDPRQISRSTHVGVGAPIPPAHQAEANAAPTLPAAEPPEPVAVIVAHGMGQQTHFETLEAIAEIVRGAEARAHGVAPPVTVRMARLDGHDLPRAEVRVTGADGRPRDVHFYECYWAPLTEGKVTTMEAVWFLILSGLRGIRLTRFRREFFRYMFDRPIRFAVPVHALFQFLAPVLVIASLLAINAIMLAVVAARGVPGGGVWVSDAMLADLTADLGAGLIGIFGGVAIAMLVPRLFRPEPRDEPPDGVIEPAAAAVSAVAWLFMLAALASIVLTAVMLAWHAGEHLRGASGRLVQPPLLAGILDGFEGGEWTLAQWLVLAVVWGGGLAVNYSVRGFLLQYVGDVAAYISSHTVSRFAEVRDAIQACALQVTEAVYRQTAPDGDAFAYPAVVVVGHSLGSVVAYDALNKLLVKEALDGVPLEAARRTRMLLTFGSPLDKTAFIFRSFRRHPTGAREALAAAKQPLILDYDHRPPRWVNLHSPNDWISGSLEYYDDKDQRDRESQWVKNEADPEAVTPLGAHVEYWKGRRLATRLYEAVTG
jgi:predicted alpha/beta hydrolase family esterase